MDKNKDSVEGLHETTRLEVPKKITNPGATVTRKELYDVISQVVGNVNQMSSFLMDDVNALYSRFVYPTYMRLQAIESLLVESGYIKGEDVAEAVKKRMEEIVEKAKMDAKEAEEAEKESKDIEEKSDGGKNEEVTSSESAKIEIIE